MERLLLIYESEFSLWFLIWAVYLINASFLTDTNKFLVTRCGSELIGIFNPQGFSISGRYLSFIALFRPWKSIFEGVWYPVPLPIKREAEYRYFRAIEGFLIPFKIFASLSFLLLLVAGPVLTHKVSLTFAILVVFSLYYLLLLLMAPAFMLSAVWRRVPKSKRQIIWLELLFFPPAGISLTNKVVSGLAMKDRLFSLFYFFGSKESQNLIYEKMREELVFTFDMDDQAAEIRLLSARQG